MVYGSAVHFRHVECLRIMSTESFINSLRTIDRVVLGFSVPTTIKQPIYIWDAINLPA